MPDNTKAPAAKTTVPPVIDTTKLTGATPDPRGDNNPGVLTDQPGSPGVNPVTNRDDSLTAEDGVTLKAPTSNEPINPPDLGEAPDAGNGKTVGGKYIDMTLDRDYWPRPGNKNHPNDTGGNPVTEWRVRAGESVSLPADEAMDLMERDIGKRTNRREG